MRGPVFPIVALCSLITAMSMAPRPLVVAAIATLAYTLVVGSPFIAVGYLFFRITRSVR